MTAPGQAVEVPWQKLSDYRCFGCSPANEKGLRLEFVRVHDGIEAALRFDRSYESYPGVVHGGMSSTVCDEVMGNLLVLLTGSSVFTTSLRMRFVSMLSVDVPYTCRATAAPGANTGRPITAHAEILDESGVALVYATGSYQIVSHDEARQRMMLSDSDADLVQKALAQLAPS